MAATELFSHLLKARYLSKCIKTKVLKPDLLFCLVRSKVVQLLEDEFKIDVKAKDISYLPISKSVKLEKQSPSTLHAKNEINEAWKRRRLDFWQKLVVHPLLFTLSSDTSSIQYQIPDGLTFPVESFSSDCQCDLDNATLAILHGCLFTPQLRKKPSKHGKFNILQLPNSLVPFDLSVCSVMKEKTTLSKELAGYLFDQCRTAGINIFSNKVNSIHTFDQSLIASILPFDQIGIPLSLIVDGDDKIDSGIVRLRHRDTAWCEAIHYSLVVQRIKFLLNQS